MSNISDRCIQGDAVTVVSGLSAESIQCVVTSPPYWGLRDYKIEPQVWGGSAACGHSWGNPLTTQRTHDDKGTSTLNGPNSEQMRQGTFQADSFFCRHCSAWRGSLGLEPTPEMYVQHIVEIFREVKRVLRRDGTCWVNLGDSYASGGTDGYSDKSTLAGFTNPATKGRVMNAESKHRSMADGLKPKDLVGIPWRVAFALQADGWWLRKDIIWSKPNPMPESVKDRPTSAHEYLFLLTKSERYYYDHLAIIEGLSGPSDIKKMLESQERIGGKHKDLDDPFSKANATTNIGRKRAVGGIYPEKQRGHSRRHAGFNDRWDLMTKEEQCQLGRNKRSVWTIATQPYPEAHFATFPEALVEPCILAGSRPGDMVLDPFCGSGTTLAVAKRFNRHYLGIDLNPEYIALAAARLNAISEPLPFDAEGRG